VWYGGIEATWVCCATSASCICNLVVEVGGGEYRVDFDCVVDVNVGLSRYGDRQYFGSHMIRMEALSPTINKTDIK
jgi:hypothetical protein